MLVRNADQPRHPSCNAPDHLLTPGAERHPDADLARPPRDRKRDDRIETDARQHQTEAAEGTEKRGDHLRRRLRSFQILRHRLRRDHRQRDVHGAQLALHRPEKGGRITRRSRNDGRRHKARLRVRAVELGRLSSEDVIRGETPRAGVADDADDLHPGVRLVPVPEATPDGVYRAEVLPRHRLGHHRDARGARAIAGVEDTPVQQRDAQRLEEARPSPDHRGVTS